MTGTPDDEPTYESRFESVEAKVGGLHAARLAGDFAAALAFADAIKDGVRAEARLASARPAPSDAVAAASWTSTQELPEAWHRWVAGWRLCRAFIVAETAGVAREREPVEVDVVVPVSRCDSLARETRVAQVVATESGVTLRRIVSQVHGETRSRGKRAVRRARLTWLADVGPHGVATFVVLVGNPCAELPREATDLVVSGDGHALEIANEHHVAYLSAQTGQLERLKYRRGHGLELFVGGEGHGEPPHIDWAHDYLAAGRFQKFRVTNWDTPPNVEVIRGPVVTIVRRWGFPHGPLHPMFPAARMLVDVSYRFFSGVPYFLKEGRMEATREFSLDYLRDDEWVFSGYSFDEQVWVDEEGRAHEGEVPADRSEQMWGVGFFNSLSHDAFVSLRIEHRVEGNRGGADASGTRLELRHADAPALHYPGHGQLWSRWALRGGPRLRPGDRLVQRNAYLTGPYAPEGGARNLEDWVRRFRSPVSVTEQDFSGVATSASPVRPGGQLAAPGEDPSCLPIKQALWEALRDVRDDMFYTVDANIGSMGYVHDVRLVHGLAGGEVEVVFTMPHRGRPMYRYLAEPVAARLRKVAGVERVTTTPCWDPAWTPDHLDDDGWAAMGFPVPDDR